MKYHNTVTYVEGIRFDSRKEAGRWLALREDERAGRISGLRRQVPFELLPAVKRKETVHLKTKDKEVEKVIQRPTYYVADFVYTDCATGEEVIVDVKSPITRANPEYRLKKKMMLALLGLTVTEM